VESDYQGGEIRLQRWRWTRDDEDECKHLCLVHTDNTEILSRPCCRRCEPNLRQVRQKISKLNTFCFCLQFCPVSKCGTQQNCWVLNILTAILKTVLSCRQFSSHHRHGQ